MSFAGKSCDWHIRHRSQVHRPFTHLEMGMSANFPLTFLNTKFMVLVSNSNKKLEFSVGVGE